MNKKYIAVFADGIEWRWMRGRPKGRFKRILSVEDIRGRKFDGVIEMYHWQKASSKIMDAYEQLKIRQPELFE